jgi:hypothetical protein
VAGLHQGEARVLAGADDEARPKGATRDNHALRVRAYCEAELAATDERDDFELIAIRDDDAPEVGSTQDAAIPLDRDAGGVQTQIFEKPLHRNARGKLVRLAVEKDASYFFSSFLFAAR